MNLNCVICAELFAPSDDVFVTPCGHMFHHVCLTQWLERSKTCPQCRNKCSDRNIHKIYFNLANLDTSKIDIGSLQQQLDTANLQVKIGQKDLKKSEEEIRNLKDVQKKCMKTISGLEDKLQKNSSAILGYTERIKILTAEAKVVDNLRKEVRALKQENELMESVSAIISASSDETEKLLKEKNEPKTLCVWVAALKRELRACENKKTDLRNTLKVVQQDLRTAQDKLKKYEERISSLESENYQLNDKVSNLENNAHTSLPQARESKRLSPDVFSDSPNPQPKRKIAGMTSLNTPSPGISERIKRIEDSNSPYFNIKSSGIGLAPLLKIGNQVKSVSRLKSTTQSSSVGAGTLSKVSSDLSEKYSIFKKPRLGVGSLTASLSAGYVPNGFGGSEKRQNNNEELTTNMTEKLKTGLSLNNRLKTGKLKRFPSAGTSEKKLNNLANNM